MAQIKVNGNHDSHEHKAMEDYEVDDLNDFLIKSVENDIEAHDYALELF